MMRGGYSRPDSSRNEEVRGGRFDNRTQYGDRNRFSRNYEGGGSSVGGRPRLTTNRLRGGEPEETKRAPQKREERSKETATNRGPNRQPRRDRPAADEDKENRPVRETQRAPRGGSQDNAQRRPSRDKSEFYKNNPNFIRVGLKKMNLYIFLMKRVFLETSHEVVEFSAIGEKAIMTALKIVETVTRVGYVTLTSIKTVTIKGRDDQGQVGKLKVLLKKTPQFDKLNEEFTAQISANPRVQAAKKEMPKVASEEEEVKSAGGVSPPQINSCAGTQEEGSGVSSQKSDTSSSSVRADKDSGSKTKAIKVEEEEEEEGDNLEGNWWLKGIDKKAIEKLALQG
jgi:hypothetical protein